MASETFEVSDTETTGFYAEIDYDEVYSCEWEYTTSNGESWSEDAEGSMIEMHSFEPTEDQDEREYMITQDVRTADDSLSYHYDNKDEFTDSNSDLIEATP
ncbi:hypothetical protein U4E84_18560 [Halorubrum sp. AD140]|uniref:hypothetical protein n=1 Tax=Halorubrum sp. AD140 TaxID=3050073 RepID=UPI002ACCC70D|nr:hypothetical protein [Halorubrum sp. AD140]MDZ5813336.1 hypothetical protein [Halorubrum sp. AD140]